MNNRIRTLDKFILVCIILFIVAAAVFCVTLLNNTVDNTVMKLNEITSESISYSDDDGNEYEITCYNDYDTSINSIKLIYGE